MGKVKLTRDQRQTVKNFMNNGNILKLTVNELHKVIDGEYEVEPEFKRGQWIYDITDENKAIIEVAYETDKRVHGFWKTEHYDIDTHVAIENARHFTKEEIAEEKERRWWAKQGREVWELKINDVLVSVFDGLYTVMGVSKNKVYFRSGDWEFKDILIRDGYKVAYFAEDRKDV